MPHVKLACPYLTMIASSSLLSPSACLSLSLSLYLSVSVSLCLCLCLCLCLSLSLSLSLTLSLSVSVSVSLSIYLCISLYLTIYLPISLSLSPSLSLLLCALWEFTTGTNFLRKNHLKHHIRLPELKKKEGQSWGYKLSRALWPSLNLSMI